MHCPAAGVAREMVTAQNKKMMAKLTQKTKAVPDILLEKTGFTKIAKSFFIRRLNSERDRSDRHFAILLGQ